MHSAHEIPEALIDIVVPVYGGWTHVERCLTALDSQSTPVNVIIVDDRSPDDTFARVRESFPHFTLLENASNMGFAKTCNVGIAAGHAPYVVLLNSDVVAAHDMAENIVRAFTKSAPSVGSVSPVLLAPGGTVDSFGICADVTLAGFVRYHSGHLSSVAADVPELLGPYGAAAAYRRTALEDVGVLDENIFMYGEELELAIRLRSGGWGAAALATVVGTHIGGASAGRESVRQRYLSGFGRAYTIRVYDLMRSRHCLRTLAVETAVSLIRLVSRRDLASLRGRFAGWRAARGVTKRKRPQVSQGIDAAITLRRSMQMRTSSYWQNDDMGE